MSALNISIFVTVAVAVVGWFAVGTQFNLHKGNKALEWLQEGLKLLGEKTSLRWLGSAAVELKIQDAKDPFAMPKWSSCSNRGTFRSPGCTTTFAVNVTC